MGKFTDIRVSIGHDLEYTNGKHESLMTFITAHCCYMYLLTVFPV